MNTYFLILQLIYLSMSSQAYVARCIKAQSISKKCQMNQSIVYG